MKKRKFPSYAHSSIDVICSRNNIVDFVEHNLMLHEMNDSQKIALDKRRMNIKDHFSKDYEKENTLHYRCLMLHYQRRNDANTLGNGSCVEYTTLCHYKSSQVETRTIVGETPQRKEAADNNVYFRMFSPNDNTEVYYVFHHMYDLWTNWRANLKRYNITNPERTLQQASDHAPSGPH
ncbi:hypothetical protein Cgig2_008318 [Carnegiea gigantea]|uniref:Uncharacterized protein n=1 Tax=Carnegiea gigantea TaxID=171969 RepID=A0A9Q1JTZ6_9CARY|nr:hypothetical protein Cgig2_008318 [Carnegiea gigantea]